MAEIVTEADKVAQENQKAWERFMKWLEQQVKGTIGALILLIWETKKEKTINWKNRPQIIDLSKDSAEDVAQKIGIIALQKEKIANTKILPNIDAINNYIDKLAQKMQIDVVKKTVTQNGRTFQIVGYAAKNLETLKHFSQILDENPLIQNALKGVDISELQR